MIIFLSDFGLQGPYVGQVQAVLQTLAPNVPQVSLMHDLPAYNTEFASYLLPALMRDMPAKGVYLCVVDPGVGGSRGAVALRIGERWFVGPDNGLFDRLVAEAEAPQWFDIVWRPPDLSDSFHGRDLFAPVAAALAQGASDGYLARSLPKPMKYSANELKRVIYIDHFGNAMAGVYAEGVDCGRSFRLAETDFRYARTFSEVRRGEPFWYKNALGLLEFSVNQGSAQQQLGLDLGMWLEDY